MKIIVIVALLLTFLSCWAKDQFSTPDTCLESNEAYQEALLAMQAELTCTNSDNLNECHEIFFAQEPLEFSNNHLKTCDQLSEQTEVIFPMAATSVASVVAINNIIQNGGLNRYVNSVEDFYHHSQLHRKRVTVLALELKRKFPSEFNLLSEHQIKNIISQHDAAKVSHSARTADGRTFYRALFEDGYGRNTAENFKADVVDKLNNKDRQIMRKTMLENGVPPNSRAADQVKKLEQIADLVDRGKSPVSAEEFGRKMKPGSHFLKNTLNANQSIVNMAKYLENHYDNIVKEFKYYKLPRLQRFELARKLRIKSKLAHIVSATDQNFTSMSLKAMTSTARTLSRKSLAGMAKLIANPRFNAAFLGVELLLSPKTLGCGLTGQHDWTIQKGSCVPQIGLTPRFIEFLNRDEQTHLTAFKYERRTCEVFKQTSELNKQSLFENIQCQPNQAELTIDKDKSIHVSFDSNGKLETINLSQINNAFRKSLIKKVTQVSIASNGNVKEFCFENRMLNSESCRAVNFNHDPLIGESDDKKIQNYLNGLSYKMNQAVSCCLGKQNSLNHNITCQHIDNIASN